MRAVNQWALLLLLQVVSLCPVRLRKLIIAHLRTSTPTPTPTFWPTYVVKPVLSSIGSSTTTSSATVDTKNSEPLITGSTSKVSLTVTVMLGLVYFLI
jgi:hypothetical protein